jgi:hypothetical protein
MAHQPRTRKGLAHVPLTKRFPLGRARVSRTQLSTAILRVCIYRHARALSPVFSPPRAPGSACLSPPTLAALASQSRVSVPACLSAPAGHVEARCVPILVGSGRCLVPIGCFFFAYRGGLTRRPGPGRGGFCFAGGKAKPLKAPKADKKEYDEVCWTLLSFHYAVLD